MPPIGSTRNTTAAAGYNFDITNSTAYDQKFVNGRNFFDSVVTIVDEIFNSYLRRQGVCRAAFRLLCNGTTVTCDGMSQWGSQNLALQGYNSVEILQAYYGDNVEIVVGAPVQGYCPLLPPEPPIRKGDISEYVVVIQVSLNRISQNYPAIPKGQSGQRDFEDSTEASVLEFQRIF